MRRNPYLFRRGGRVKGAEGEVPDILLVTAGQSNVGNNNSSGLSNPISPAKVWYWHEDSNVFYSGAGTADATGTTGNSFVDQAIVTATTPDKYCVDLGTARRLQEAGASPAVLRVWQGSTNLFSDWAAPPDSGSKNLFGLLSSEGAAAVAHPSFPLENDYIVRVFWVQGEADAAPAPVGDPNAYHLNYQNRLQNWWDTFKALPWVPANAEIVVLQLNAANARPFTAEIRAAQAAFVTANSDAFLLNADDLPLADADHYASVDADVVGVRAADSIISRLPISVPDAPPGRTYRTVRPSSSAFATIPSVSRPAVPGGVQTVWAAWLTDANSLSHEQQVWTAFDASRGYRHLIRDGSPGRVLHGFRDAGGASRLAQRTLSPFTPGEVQRSCFVFRQNGSNFELEQYLNGVSLGSTSFPDTVGFSDAATLPLQVLRQAAGTNTDNTRFLGVCVGVGVALSDTQVSDHDAEVVSGGAYAFPGATHLFDAADYDGGVLWTDSIGSVVADVTGSLVRATIIPTWAT